MSKIIRLIGYLAKSEHERTYRNGVTGLLMSLLPSVATILVIWLAIDYGLGLSGKLGLGYGFTLAVGLVAWLVIPDACTEAMGSVLRSPHLIKKAVFQSELIPVSSVVSRLLAHLVLLGVFAIFSPC